MAWAVAACLTGGEGLTTIRDAGCVGVSYPSFFDDLAAVIVGADGA
jgi:5-enolpyruvylshikimate-3-phosphate synthase